MARDVRPIEERRLLGIGLALGAFLCFTAIDTCSKWLSQNAELPVTQVIFLRYGIQLLLVFLIFFPTRRFELFVTKNLRVQVVRGLVLLGSTVCNFIAILYLPLPVLASIAFTVPLMVSALSVPFLGETVGWRRWLAIIVGFIGVLVIVRPGTEAFHPAFFLSIAASFFSACYALLTRRLAGVDAVTTQQFYSGAVATACLVPLVIWGGWLWPSDLAGWLAFVTIGMFALIGHQLLTTAHRYAPASVLAPFGYVQIISMTASSWLIFNQPPTVWLFIGAPLVIGSGLYIWLRERQLSKTIVTDVTVRN